MESYLPHALGVETSAATALLISPPLHDAPRVYCLILSEATTFRHDGPIP